MKKIIIYITAIVIIAGSIYAGVVYKKNKASNKPEASQVTKDNSVVELTANDGETVLAATKRVADVKYTESANGALVASINGKENSDSQFWMYQINDKEGTVAADRFFCKDGDKIKWEYKGF